MRRAELPPYMGDGAGSLDRDIDMRPQCGAQPAIETHSHGILHPDAGGRLNERDAQVNRAGRSSKMGPGGLVDHAEMIRPAGEACFDQDQSYIGVPALKGPVMDRLHRSDLLRDLSGEVFLSRYEAFTKLRAMPCNQSQSAALG